MGFQDSKGGFDMDGERWVIAGIPLRAPLKPIFTNPNTACSKEADGEELSTTPTGDAARIPARLNCQPPPPPRKRKPSLKFRYPGVREFFTPPHDLESVFIRRVEKAN